MLSSIKCIIIYPNATMKDCNEFDTGMAGPKSENLWSNPFVFSSTIKYLKYKKITNTVYTDTMPTSRCGIEGSSAPIWKHG